MEGRPTCPQRQLMRQHHFKAGRIDAMSSSKHPFSIMPSVAILLCTFNGARFLPAQLSSLARQRFSNWRLFVSDDGSTDETLSLISKYQREETGVSVAVRDGPRRGLVRNFLGLACDLSISADYFAFSDQDDIWEPDKLSRAIEWLQSIPAKRPPCTVRAYVSLMNMIAIVVYRRYFP